MAATASIPTEHHPQDPVQDSSANKTTTIRQITIRNPPYTYLHLTLLTPAIPPSAATSSLPAIDILTACTKITSALNQFLGITGTAIPIDYLKAEGRDVWIRVPREDGTAVVAALSQWVGNEGSLSWRVRERGEWLGCVAAGDGQRLFEA